MKFYQFMWPHIHQYFNQIVQKDRLVHLHILVCLCFSFSICHHFQTAPSMGECVIQTDICVPNQIGFLTSHPKWELFLLLSQDV